jgi:DNA adenine methylase
VARTASPLRYPGGKSALNNTVAAIMRENRIDLGHYAEPFAGGGGLALSLLFDGTVREIHLNDIDPTIGAFWRSAIHNTEDLIQLIKATPVTIEEWHRQKDIYNSDNATDDLALGFSTLFLNRTNRSGIIKGAGVIGGLKQTGNYQLDCRFNKENICKRIKRIAKYRNRIHFSQMDALDFLTQVEAELPARSLICADPPYYGKGSKLYTSFYEHKDHAALATAIMKVNLPWITTYDNCSEIRGLYLRNRQYDFSVQYSAQTKRLGSELLIVSKGLRIPSSLPFKQSHKPTYNRSPHAIPA